MYEQIGYEAWKAMFPFAGRLFEEAFRYAEEFGGYFGPGEEAEVEWAVEQVGGRKALVGLEAFFEREPFRLQG